MLNKINRPRSLAEVLDEYDLFDDDDDLFLKGAIPPRPPQHFMDRIDEIEAMMRHDKAN